VEREQGTFVKSDPDTDTYFLMFHSEEKRKVSYLAEEFNMTKATISDSIKVLEQKKVYSKGV
jgi:predicted transcriptional regulator